MDNLKKTPLNAEHRALGAKMVDFGGWDMPVQYTGIIDEHVGVRTRAGLFDVSHMGEIWVEGPQALDLVQFISSNDASKLALHQIQYSGLLTPEGCFVDDMLVHKDGGRPLPARGERLQHRQGLRVDPVAGEGLRRDGHQQEPRDGADRHPGPALPGDPPAPGDGPGPGAHQVLLVRLRDRGWASAASSRGRATRARTGSRSTSPRQTPRPSGGRSWRPASPTASSPRASAPGTPCASRRAWRSTATTSTTPPRSWTRTWGGSSSWASPEPSTAGRSWRSRRPRVRRASSWPSSSRTGASPATGYDCYAGGQKVGVVTSGTQAPFLKKPLGMAYLPVALAKDGCTFEVDIRGKRTPAVVVPKPIYKRAK